MKLIRYFMPYILAFSAMLISCGELGGDSDANNLSSSNNNGLLPGSSSSKGDAHNNNKAGSFTDPRDSKTYKYTTIGSQTWMAENLNYNGEGSKCGATDDKLKDENTINCTLYGRL